MKPVGLYYCRSQNFGDALNPLIFERVLGLPVRYAKKRSAKLCGIGSILDGLLGSPSLLTLLTVTCLPTLHVFSSGFTFPPPKYRAYPIRAMCFHAVRGRQTQQQLVDFGWLMEDQPIAYGDAALLAPFLLERDVPKKYACGIIPHVAERDCAEVEMLAEATRHSVVIDFERPPLEVLEQMASCEVIVSSAMHGLIVADALGIPNLWMKMSDRIIGSRYKFDDYYSAYPGYPKEPITVYDIARANEFPPFSKPNAVALASLQAGLRDAFSVLLTMLKG